VGSFWGSFCKKGCLSHELGHSPRGRFGRHAIALQSATPPSDPPHFGWQKLKWPENGPLDPPLIQKVPHLEGTGHELVMFGRRSAVVKRREFRLEFAESRRRAHSAGLSLLEGEIHLWIGGIAGSSCRLSDAVDDPSAPFEFFATNVFGTKRLAIALPTGNSTICPALRNHVFLFTQTRVA
jgi:hypothetical protein